MLSFYAASERQAGIPNNVISLSIDVNGAILKNET